jgi:hypothetical protein
MAQGTVSGPDTGTAAGFTKNQGQVKVQAQTKNEKMRQHILSCQTFLGQFWEFCHPGSRERERTIVIVTSVCLILCLILSWPLWFRDSRVFLPSPILPVLLDLPLWTDKILFFGVLASAVILFARAKLASFLAIFPVVFIVWVLQDSLRWQPFLYMYAFAFLSIFFNTRLKENALYQNKLLPLQLMVIGVYFWAGIGKLNPYFYENVFPWFVSPIFTGPFVNTASHIVPFLELSIGVCLAVPALRLMGLGLAGGMLLIVLMCLGPLGHNWGIIVWPWNVFIFTLACACFINRKENILTLNELKRPLALLAALLFLILPAGGQFGYWGAHPSFKLYSGDIPSGIVILGDGETGEGFPPVLTTVLTGNKINLVDWTINEFSIAATPSIPGYSPYATGAEGLCRYLKEPDKAYLSIEMPELRSLQKHDVLTIMPLCLAAKPP